MIDEAQDIQDEDEEELKPLEIIDKTPKEEPKNPTSYDTPDEYDYTPSDAQIKEMTDAQ